MRSGALIRIKGPQEFGKSSLMAKAISKAEEAGAKIVGINFRELDFDSMGSLNKFLAYFCDLVTFELGFESQLDERRAEKLGYKKACGDYFQSVLLPQIPNLLVLELDEVDILLDSHQEKTWIVEFFSMLRTWHDDKMKANAQWQKLRLVLVHSRHIDTLPERQSPFNVGDEMELSEFSEPQILALAKLHGVSEGTARELMGLVGGHPQLVRQGLYAIARQQVSLEQLMENGATEAGLYGRHLEQMRRRLDGNSDLKAAMRQVLAAKDVEVRIDLAHKAMLRSLGLVVFQRNGVRVACELYRQYFLDLWK